MKNLENWNVERDNFIFGNIKVGEIESCIEFIEDFKLITVRLI